MSTVREAFDKIRNSLSPKRKKTREVDKLINYGDPEARRQDFVMFTKNNRELRATKDRIQRESTDTPIRDRRRASVCSRPEPRVQAARRRSVSLGLSSEIPNTSDTEI